MIDPARHADAPVHTFEHHAMACTFGLCVVHDDAAYARRFARAAFDEIDRVELLLSRFIPHSEIAQLNQLAPGASLRISEDTLACLQLASELHAATGGAFDIAYRGQAAKRPPTDVAPPPLVFDPQQHAVGVRAAVDLDLGGLGKGYALDQVAALLREWQIDAALVHSGQSTAYAHGAPPETTGWSVHLRTATDADQTSGTLTLRGRAIAGSGQRLHGDHIVDPRNGTPVARERATWAVAPSAALADALSTAFMVMDAAHVRRLCERERNVWAILPRSDSDAAPLEFLPHEPGFWIAANRSQQTRDGKE